MYKQITSVFIAIIFTYLLFNMINSRECIVINEKNK